jgi:Uncharacterized conserved protein
MNLAEAARHTGVGALAGALVGCLLLGLGLGPILGDPSITTVLTVALLLGAPFGAVRREHWLFVVSGVLLLLYYFITTGPVMGRIANQWVRDDGRPSGQDAIVVLSGYVQSDSALNISGTERLLSAIELYRSGVAPRIVTTRVDIDDALGHRSSTIDQQRLLSLAGITSGWIEVDSVSSTRDEAVRSAKRLLPEGLRHIVVVTSPFHTRRACATFEAVGFTVSCFPSRSRGVATQHPHNSEERLAAFGEYVYERLGMIKYRWKGWIQTRDPRGDTQISDLSPPSLVHLYFHRRDAVLTITRGSRVPT